MKAKILYGVIGLLIVVWAGAVLAQSENQAINLAKEGKTIFDNAKSKDDYQRAAQKYEEALKISERVKSHKMTGMCSYQLGVIQSRLGQYQKSLEYYEQSLAISKKIGNAKGEGANFGNIGSVYNSLSQYDKALEYYEQSLAINRKIGNVSGEGGNLGSIGSVYNSLSQYDKALEYYEQSLAINKKIGNVSGEGANLSSIGWVYVNLGQYTKALEYYEQALTISKKIGNVKGESGNLNDIGVVYKNLGQYTKVLDYYEQSLAINRKIGNVQGEGGNLNNIGRVYKDLGQYTKSLEYHEQSLQIRKKIGDVKGEGYSLNNIGEVYGSLGQYTKALAYYDQSLQIIKKIGDVNMEGTTLSNMGQLYALTGKTEDALNATNQALEISEKLGTPTSGRKDAIANLYLDFGVIAKAEPLIKETKYDSSLGRLALIKSDYSSAQRYYEKDMKRAEKTRNTDALFRSYTGLGMAYENLGDDKSAEEYYRKAVDLTEEVRSSLSRDQREKFFDVKVNGFRRTAPYDGLARVRLRMGKTVEALKISEYTKARIFAESMSERSDSSDFDIAPEVKKQDEDLNNRLPALKEKRQEAYEKGNKLLIEALEPQVKELEAKLQAHIRMLREKYPVFAATKYPQPMDLEQTALNADEWVLEYHVTDPGIIIYLSKGKQLLKALFKPKPRNDLEKLVLEYRKPLEVIPGKDKLEEKLASFSLPIGKELSDLLLTEVLDLVPKGASIIIVPDDCLGTVPFEMLTLNDKGSVKTDKAIPYVSGAEFFGDRNLLSYYQSVTALTLTRNHSKGKAAGGGLLAIVDPVFSEKDKRTSEAPKKEEPTGVFASLLKSMHLMGAEGTDQMGGLKFPRLELTDELAESLAKIEKLPADIIRGFDATKDNFVQNFKPSLKKYDKIVFATHGYFGKDLPGIMEPVLVLTLVPHGTDGFLRMTEVMGMDMNAQIVALTACQTGLGTSVSGEGTMGMGRAFQYAGAKSVLMSLWSVSEVASVRLVKSFFQNLKAGKSKPEALELARSELRKGIWNHPFFWAGFILVGETN